MKRKTKNFFEDLLLVSIFVAIVYGSYYFVTMNDNEGKFVFFKEVETVTKEKEEPSFFTNLYEDIKNIFSSKKDEVVTKDETESKKENQAMFYSENKRIYPQLRNFDINTKKEENSTQNTQTEIENSKLEDTQQNSSTLDTTNNQIEVKAVSSETSQENSTENKNSSLEETNTQISQTSQSTTQIASTSKENTTSQQETENTNKEDEATKQETTNKDTNSTPKVELTQTKNITNIDDFFVEFEKNVYASIKNSENSSKLKSGDSINIRVTILKDGSFEQLTFVNGNLNNFNLIKDAIEKVFPLQIDSSIRSNFPRYYRMKIVF